MLDFLFLASIIPILLADSTKVKVQSQETIPEFFDDSANVYCLIIGFAIMMICLIIAIIIYRVKARQGAFENSLFQNLQDQE